MRGENFSIESIKDNLNHTEVTIVTSTEASINPPNDDTSKEEKYVPEQKEEHSSSVTSLETNLFRKNPIPTSINYIDINLSSKYPVTLEQARNRVLRAIKRAKKRNLLLEEDD